MLILISDIIATKCFFIYFECLFNVMNEDFPPYSKTVDMVQQRLIRGLTNAQFVRR